MEKKLKILIQEGVALFTRILMKYDVMEKVPIDIGDGYRLNASHIHMIEAVGKGYGKTVTALSGYFMITKGAVSQIISKLYNKGYITKTKRKGNDKEIILELTEKGWKAFECHEEYGETAMNDVMQIGNKYDEGELNSFLNILKDIDLLFGKFIAEEKKK
jgi:DNA-binding MarR family transcriptional regulator